MHIVAPSNQIDSVSPKLLSPLPPSFLSSIDLEELKKFACSIKGAASCRLSDNCIIGGFAILYEIIFPQLDDAGSAKEISEGAVNDCWLARFPFPHIVVPQTVLDANMVSSIAAMKFFKERRPEGNLKDLVPEVYGYALKDDPHNKVGQSFSLMEKKGGTTLGSFYSDLNLSNDDSNIERLARKFHQQLATVVLELASVRFSRIGTLVYDKKKGLSVGPFYSVYCCSPAVRGHAYQLLPKKLRGPFSTISAWYLAMSELNYEHAKLVLKEEKNSLREKGSQAAANEDAPFQELQSKAKESMEGFLVLKKVGDELLRKENMSICDAGPFVINHDDLNWDNILVDDDLNFTAIIDFPGTVVPLPSLLVYPYMFQEEPPLKDHKSNPACRQYFTSKEQFFQSILAHYDQVATAKPDNITTTNRVKSNTFMSFLQSLWRRNTVAETDAVQYPPRSLIEILMRSQTESPIDKDTVPSIATPETRQNFEIALTGPFDPETLPTLFEAIFGRKFDKQAEYGEVSKEADKKLKSKGWRRSLFCRARLGT